MKRLVYATAVAIAISSAVLAGAEEAYLKTAQILYSSASDQEPAVQRASYQQVRDILDRIVREFPSSDIAVRILLKDNLDGLDVAALDAALGQQAAAETSATGESPEEAQQVPAADDAASETPSDAPVIEMTLPVGEGAADIPGAVEDFTAVPPRPETEIVADVQTELNRLGCNAGTADGVAGRNTRTAFQNFIADSGSDLNEDDLATEDAVTELREKTGTICKARTMASTPASALTGSWGFQGDCPGLGNRVIRNTGRLNMRYAGNNTLRGTATNSQGISGPAVIQFQGGRTAATVIKFGFFTLEGNLTRSSRNMTISGTGARRCKISVWKN